MSIKRLSRIALLSGLCLVLRQVFAGLPNIQPLTAIFIVLVTAWGVLDSLLVMSLTMLISSFLLGFGIWVVFQLITYSLLLMVWYCLTRLLQGVKLSIVVVSLGAASLGLAYGFIIDSISAWFYQMPWWTYVLAGLPFNLAHALSTLLFYPVMKSIFRRISYERYLD